VENSAEGKKCGCLILEPAVGSGVGTTNARESLPLLFCLSLPEGICCSPPSIPKPDPTVHDNKESPYCRFHHFSTIRAGNPLGDAVVVFQVIFEMVSNDVVAFARHVFEALGVKNDDCTPSIIDQVLISENPRGH